MNNVTAPKRAYNQGRRAEAAEATAERIVEAFSKRLAEAWFDEIRLDDVAADAGVTVQTVLRRFGSKDGLLEAACERLGQEIRARRTTPPGEARAAVHAVVVDYESAADLVLRVLAQEDRYPPLRRMADVGRAGHRAWLAHAFAPWLDERHPERLDALVILMDVYVWKLIRRDMGQPPEALEAFIVKQLPAALDATPFALKL